MNDNQDSKWEIVISDWDSSGLSRREYCKRSGIKEHQLSYWQAKLLRPKTEEAKFVSVSNVSSYIELEIGKVKLKLPSDFSSKQIAELVKCLN